MFSGNKNSIADVSTNATQGNERFRVFRIL